MAGGRKPHTLAPMTSIRDIPTTQPGCVRSLPVVGPRHARRPLLAVLRLLGAVASLLLVLVFASPAAAAAPFTVIVLLATMLLVTAVLRLARLVRRSPESPQEEPVSDTVPAETAPTRALIARMTRWHAAGPDQRTSP